MLPKVLVIQKQLCAKHCKLCQRYKNYTRYYGNLPPKIITEQNMCNVVHICLIISYVNDIIHNQPGGAITPKYNSLNCMITIEL